jgi:predicted deacylase
MKAALQPYLSPEARGHRVGEIVRRLGATQVTYGRSIDGEPLVAVRVRAHRPDAPAILCTANIHGPEYVGGEVAFGLLEALADPTAPAARLRERAEVWVIPCLNPDGYRRTWERSGRGPLVNLRPNARGVDLNRNYPLPAGRPSFLPGAGSTQPGTTTYRGTAPLSEPETRSLEALLHEVGFHASANLHSFMGTMIPARVTDRSSFATYLRLCAAFAAGQPRIRYRRLSHRLLDVFTGEQEDHQHHAHDSWAMCIETFSIGASYRQHLRAPSTFWRFNPRDPRPWVENDVGGLVAFFEAALGLPRPTAGS